MTASPMKWAVNLLTVLPVLFLFAMIQMSGLTLPFWDHWEQAEFIITYHDRGLGAAVWQVLTGLSQHTRPVTVRLVFLLNGILTDWNIATEYVYLYAVIGLTLLAHYRIIRKLSGSPRRTLAEAVVFSVAVVLVCSPAGHNNHWWSWMLQLNLNGLLTVLALAVIAFNPRSWAANATAAVLCWLSVYTLTNGLFLILVVAALAQLASEEPFKPRAIAAFWIANIVLISVTYFPIAEPGMTARPALVDVATFALVYLGQPLAALVSFPYENMFEPPPLYELGLSFGLVFVATFLWLLWINRSRLRRPGAPLLLLLGFGGFALVSALGTGWARVTFDAYGVRNGGSSRYVITGSLMILGILYYAFADRAWLAERLPSAKAWTSVRRLSAAVAVAAYAAFIALSVRAYADSLAIYRMAEAHNRTLAVGFRPDGWPSPVDQFLYPGQTRLHTLRSDLLRLRLGPYRLVPEAGASFATAKFIEAFALVPGARFTQRFKAAAPNLSSLSLPFVTWGQKPDGYAVNWTLSVITVSGMSARLGQGSILASKVTDWQTVELRPQKAARETGEYELVLEVAPGSKVRNPIGVALYAPAAPPDSPMISPLARAPAGMTIPALSAGFR